MTMPILTYLHYVYFYQRSIGSLCALQLLNQQANITVVHTEKIDHLKNYYSVLFLPVCDCTREIKSKPRYLE